MESDLLTVLREDGFVRSAGATLTPITGGVSSDVFLLDDDGRKVVVKRAIPKLRVKDDWFADVSRNAVEQDYLRYVGAILPDAVPRVLSTDRDRGYFVMEYLGDDFRTWKQQMMAGECRDSHARAAGTLAGTVHRRSFLDPRARRLFNTDKNFFDLRIESYLLTTARRHPPLRDIIEAEASRVGCTKEALVHGDYSPKNMLVHADRFVLVDCETAWFGDPSFDLAFVCNHLCLKALYHAPRKMGLDRLFNALWGGYREARSDDEQFRLMQSRVATLLPMLLLARVDGKSPAEYLVDESKKKMVRDFAYRAIPSPGWNLDELASEWFDSVLRSS